MVDENNIRELKHNFSIDVVLLFLLDYYVMDGHKQNKPM
jgi:hypothetical protein